MSIYLNSNYNSFDGFESFYYGENQSAAAAAPVELQQQVKEIRSSEEKGPIFVVPQNWRARLHRDFGDRYAPLHILANPPKVEEIDIKKLPQILADNTKKESKVNPRKEEVDLKPIIMIRQPQASDVEKAPTTKEEGRGILALLFAFLSSFFSGWDAVDSII